MGPKRNRKPLNVTLDDDTMDILCRLSEELGLPRARVLEIGVRALAEADLPVQAPVVKDRRRRFLLNLGTQ